MLVFPGCAPATALDTLLLLLLLQLHGIAAAAAATAAYLEQHTLKPNNHPPSQHSFQCKRASAACMQLYSGSLNALRVPTSPRYLRALVPKHPQQPCPATLRTTCEHKCAHLRAAGRTVPVCPPACPAPCHNASMPHLHHPSHCLDAPASTAAWRSAFAALSCSGRPRFKQRPSSCVRGAIVGAQARCSSAACLSLPPTAE